ncbi:GNAT family N-acetyltransferase [Paenibacillus sp. N1-5-1-14]|uniref:GNAT family N-acetyltransferase n=1 Tax=Paenibacillus radicibacter TaxID=2972488 RepID=UPI0021592200|nr:GNAT family N-acetyltransferase [Paenibacillus radicibacter]MCR8644360.1 GNAT family N-acetyltransferase [Paenibacillus radicibacter]
MIRLCTAEDRQDIYEIINDAAVAYKGIIPSDRFHEPYMSMEHLNDEIHAGVVFWGYEDNGVLGGIMGIQDKGDVVLIRHAYVRTNQRGSGIGTKLLAHLTELSTKPFLIGTWEDASWAIQFYIKNGFKLTSSEEKVALLQKYWNIPARQVETSVVLCDSRWKE